MSIITKPSILKGVAAQITLNKSELELNSVVVADPYFSDSENWYRVSLVYKSSLGGQYEVVDFDASQAIPSGNFFVSEKARDSFEILKIKIMDFDGGFLEIPRSSLTVADFDISFTVTPPSGPSLQTLTWDTANKTGVGTVTTGPNGFISKTSGGAAYNVNVLSNQVIEGDGYVEVVYNSSFINTVFGFAETISPTGSYTSSIYAGYNAGGGWEAFTPSGTLIQSLQNNLLVPGDVIRIERVGTLYRTLKNGLLVHSVIINNTNPLKVSISIYPEGNGVNNVTVFGS